MTSRLLLGLLLALTGCKGKPKKESAGPRPVKTMTIESSASAAARTFAGATKAGGESRLSFKVGGALRKLPATVGTRVKAGDVIAEIDARDYAIQVREAGAALAQAAAQARAAKATYGRVRRLYENRNASAKDLDSARARAHSARALVAAASERVKLARSQLSYCKLRAPSEGTIAAVPGKVNENVRPGQVIAVLNSDALPEVTIAVPESMISGVRKGSGAKVHITALGDGVLRAKVSEVGVVATNSTTFPVTVRLSKANDQVRPGMAAEVTLSLSRRRGKRVPTIIVPAHAVLEDQRGRYVFVAEVGDGDIAIVKRRTIKTGKLGPYGIPVTSGVKAGDQLIVAGLRFVENDMNVRVLNATAAKPKQ